MNELERLCADIVSRGELHAAILTGPREQGESALRKVEVRPVPVRGETAYQFTSYTARQASHRNLPLAEAAAHLAALTSAHFKQAHLETAEADYQVLLNKKREIRVTRRPKAGVLPLDLRHDRQKRYLIPEGTPCAFLHHLGVMTEAGKVVAAKYDKFRQINRFLEMVADVAEHLPTDRPLHVVDFGCGKSYLTFALYHYLREIRQREVRIVGLDLKQDVIAHCNRVAQELGYTGLTFQVGAIQNYRAETQIDMVVSLHACDTATDEALIQAVEWEAKVILSVPCCQHELFRQIENEAMRPLLKHGILKERFSALVTDSLRAQLLEIAGYSVQVLEFIDMEHTPKNLLLRAVRQKRRVDREGLLAEYARYRDFWHAAPTMERILEEVPPSL